MSDTLHIVLAGNPNCGKSSLFNALTGLRQKVGNFPGVTVDRKSGSFFLEDRRKARVIDLPGAYNLYPASEDERIASEVLRNPQHPDRPDLVVYVADATNLRRSLIMCTQIMDLGLPVLLALNMSDLLESEGLDINPVRLSDSLGIPVVSISARKQQGLKELRQAMSRPVAPVAKPFFSVPDWIGPALEKLGQKGLKPQPYTAWQALLDPGSSPWLPEDKLREMAREAGISEPGELVRNELSLRNAQLSELLEDSVRREEKPREKFSGKLDAAFLHPVWGYFIFIGILLTIFQAIFAWAQWPMEGIDFLFSETGAWMESALPEGVLTDLWINGIWAGLSGIVIFIPQIAFLFFFITLLEDTGYMSRAVFLMDRLMRPFGFSGRSVIPLIGGMACAVPSIMMARTIPNRKERLITIMVTPLMSCSARIPVYILLIGMFVPEQQVLGFLNLQGLVMAGMYLLGFLMALVVAFVLKLILKYKGQGIFVTELPIYRSPRWRNALSTVYHKSATFVTEAGRVILVISMILWYLSSYGPGDEMQRIETEYDAAIAAATSPEQADSLSLVKDTRMLESSYAGRLGRWIEPLIEPLGFDWKIGISLVTSFAAREVFVGTMATLYSVEESELEDEEGGRFERLRNRMLQERDPETGLYVYTPATALSLLIFYAFAMQCMSTLAITKKETGSWLVTLGMLFYMTGLAWMASFVTYQLMA